MNQTDAQCTREQLCEAAVWMTLLRSADRSSKTDRGFRRWLAANPGHRAAFEAASAGWEMAGVLPRSRLPKLSRWQRAGYRHAFASVVAALALAVIGLTVYQRYAGETTDIGEQRILTLSDGTRVFLNTDTRVVVDYGQRQRTVNLKRGEAYFEVASKDADWPFVVLVGDRRVHAVGTAFVVRQDSDRFSVTLVEGKVNVLPRQNMPPIPLQEGERLTFKQDFPPGIDRPSLDRVLAWRTGYVDLEVMSLAEAVAEMNRYSHIELVVKPDAAAIPVFGVFRAGDSESFANAVADTYGLRARQESKRITLESRPITMPQK